MESDRRISAFRWPATLNGSLTLQGHLLFSVHQNVGVGPQDSEEPQPGPLLTPAGLLLQVKGEDRGRRGEGD